MRPKCRACDAEIRWARTANGKAIPLDAEPNPDGNVLLDYSGDDETTGSAAGGTGSPIAHVIGKNGVPLDLAHLGADPRYMPHHATCPNWPKR